MKFTANLAAAESTRDRYALNWAIPAAAIGLAVFILLCRAWFHESREYRQVQTELVSMQAQSRGLREREDVVRRRLDSAADRKLLRRIQYVKGVIMRRKLSVSELTLRIVKLLPADAHLTELGLTSTKKPGEGYTVRMGIATANEESVEVFLNRLEDAPGFKDVSIINQGFQEQISQPDPVNIVCTAQYWPEVATGEEKSDAKESTSVSKPNR